MRTNVFLALALAVPSLLYGQAVEARISAEPPLSPDEVSQLESNLIANPANKEARLRLLRYYMAFGPRRAERLNHVLYMVENFPADPASSSPMTNVFVPAVHDAWNRAVTRMPENPDVLLNASRFLYHEHPEDAEQLLSRVVDRDPANKRIAANLGFLYAMDILGMTSPDGGPAKRAAGEQERLRENARFALDRSRNVFVLAGAGTALPNLFPRTEQARNPNDRSAFEMASSLMARARELSPQEPEFQGPMPLIQEFQKFQQREMPQLQSASTVAPPGSIRVGSAVQAAKLVEKPEAVYPPKAREARIQGIVRFNVVIARDGSVENATLLGGHPLFVPIGRRSSAPIPVSADLIERVASCRSQPGGCAVHASVAAKPRADAFAQLLDVVEFLQH